MTKPTAPPALVEADLTEFGRGPVGRFVRSRNLLIAWPTASFACTIARGSLEREDIELQNASLGAFDHAAPAFVTVFDARALTRIDDSMLPRWLWGYRALLKRVRGRLVRNALLVPKRPAATVFTSGIISVVPPPWEHLVTADASRAVKFLAPYAPPSTVRLLAQLAGRLQGGKPPREALSPREAEVAALVAEGYSDLNVAATLGIEESTVGTHLRSVYRKLQLHSRAALAGHLLRRRRG